jgi:hypothetical protein
VFPHTTCRCSVCVATQILCLSYWLVRLQLYFKTFPSRRDAPKTVFRGLSFDFLLTFLIEKLIVTHLVKKFPRFYRTWLFVTVCHWTLPEASWIQSAPSHCFSKIHFSSSLLRPGLPSVPFSLFRFANWNVVGVSYPSSAGQNRGSEWWYRAVYCAESCRVSVLTWEVTRLAGVINHLSISRDIQWDKLCLALHLSARLPIKRLVVKAMNALEMLLYLKTLPQLHRFYNTDGRMILSKSMLLIWFVTACGLVGRYRRFGEA